MKLSVKLTFLILTIVLSFILTSCDSDKSSFSDTDTAKISSAESRVEEKKNANELKEQIIGQWGRLEEVMHYFTDDMRCVIGGMQGTYDIDEDCRLVLTTMSGSVTTYDWASSRGQTQSENYWYLDGDTLTVNGNNFTKIYTDETIDYAE